MKMYFYKGCEIIKKNKLKIIIILSIVLVVFFSGFCFAKYDYFIKFFFESKTAIPILELEGKETAKISALNNVGYYDFIVKNYNEEKVSDVAQKYTIEAISNTDESIEFELFSGDEEIEFENNKTDKIYIEAENKAEHLYRLKVTYDKDKSNAQTDVQEDVQIKVHSEQVKK